MNDTTLLSKFEPKPTKQVIEYERQLFQARFSPCGKFLIASGYDATIQRWNLSDAEATPLNPCLGHHAWVQCLAFLPATERMVTADSWGQLAIWNYTDETPSPVWRHEAAHDGWIRSVAVSPDGQRIASGGNDRMLRIWSASDGALLKEWHHPEKIFSLCFHPSGTSLVSGDLKGVIRDWDVDTATARRELDARVLYQFDRIQECGGVRCLNFDSDGRQLVCAGQKTPGGGFATGFPCALVFDWESGQLTREMQIGKNDDGFAYDTIFHPAGFVMATSCAFPGKGFVWCWLPQDEKPFYESKSIPNGRSLSLHADGRRIALLVSQSPNGNGRKLVDGVYQGGSARIHILEFSDASGISAPPG